ncbi:hypothetical protein DFH09DRAFT_1302763 [Mycena vulgaris]|nr:hypothetical protein DFH09DRAFT_1302763 [Mycena vulgaris]
MDSFTALDFGLLAASASSSPSAASPLGDGAPTSAACAAPDGPESGVPADFEPDLHRFSFIISRV